ncbi:MAG: NUDIX domain-containing protein [Acidobacteria bacterium]|nr:NUDIX domain-containing protein [Acidobacteriota bacterium]
MPWAAVEASLRAPQRGPNPHKLSPRIPESTRRAAVAVVLWGDGAGARKLVLVQRGHGAPRHAGELAFPGGMVEPEDRDLPHTARRELEEELGLREGLWELGCYPDGVAKALTRFTPVLFRWEVPHPVFHPNEEIHDVLLLPLEPLIRAPWTTEVLERNGLSLVLPRLELPEAPLWGATAYVLKAWLDGLAGELVRASRKDDRPG